jgi:hypothetical protein
MKNLYPILFAFLLCASMGASAQVPNYNSYPSASATIFLDFDGQTVEGTSWNMNGPIICGPSNMSNAQITEIFKRVAEDYRPFNVNVTTDSTKYWAAPADMRIRIVLTVTNEWYGNSAGGVSYMGAFTWGDNTPSFVFTKLLGYNTKNVAEAASHEAGHSLGLRHQAAYNTSCVKTADYNPGTGSGEIGWAPIMGVGYYRNFTLWNNGANPYGCTNYQNDLQVITSYNGFSYRPDDFTSDFKNSTTQMSFVNNKFNVDGVIETSGDADVVKFTIPVTSLFHLNAVPFNLGDGYTGANLDMQVDLLSVSKAVIGTYNPADQLLAKVDTVLTAGTYYLQVQGRGNVYAPQYASLGSYTLQAEMAPLVTLPVHKLELHGNKENNRHILDWVIEADGPIAKQTVEVSTNGRDFQAIAEPAVTARTFTYIPSVSSGVLNYRLNVVMNDGQQYYSNIAAIPAPAAPRPSLAGNLVQATMSVNSPALFEYQISDYSGRLVGKGKLVQGMNKIASSGLSSGMYIIQFSDGQNQYSEKFMKQ